MLLDALRYTNVYPRTFSSSFMNSVPIPSVVKMFGALALASSFSTVCPAFPACAHGDTHSKSSKKYTVSTVPLSSISVAISLTTGAAIEEGIVPGGGVTYIRAIDALEGMKGDNADETTGIEIIKRAIEEPLRQIVANAGKEGAVIVQKVREGKGDFGYNARTDVYENLHAAGVVDPAKVTRVALENAASIAGMFLTTECVIVEKKEDKPEMPAAPGMGGMGGMM
jgi:hypothetical protein